MLNSRVTLCCGEFLRQELERTLVQHGCRFVMDSADPPFLEDFTIAAIEIVIIHALSRWGDRETSAHAQRLVGLAESVGISLHLAKSDLMLLRLAALLHDIGKVAIPESILLKQGPLDTEERALMRLHPELGRVILQHAGGLFEQIAPLVVAHHESWDGGGYPTGLVGNEIPLLARILAVVDSYDAMTSYRVYGKPLPISQACQELLRCAGYQYDPLVVDAFLSLFGCPPFELEGQRAGMLFHLPWRTAYLLKTHALDVTILSEIAQ
jgi:HD-GYP domain-containing protein (c-di-GMP phosphodiesterase class II)